MAAAHADWEPSRMQPPPGERIARLESEVAEARKDIADLASEVRLLVAEFNRIRGVKAVFWGVWFAFGGAITLIVQWALKKAGVAQ